MMGLLLALMLGTAHVQECGAYSEAGPNVGHVVWWGTPSADLAPIGAGACTGTAWVDPLGVEIASQAAPGGAAK